MRQASRLLARASAFRRASALLASAVSATDPLNPKHLSATSPGPDSRALPCQTPSPDTTILCCGSCSIVPLHGDACRFHGASWTQDSACLNEEMFLHLSKYVGHKAGRGRPRKGFSGPLNGGSRLVVVPRPFFLSFAPLCPAVLAIVPSDHSSRYTTMC